MILITLQRIGRRIMTEKQKNIIKYSISFAGVFVLMWLSFKGVEWKSFFGAMLSCNWKFVLLSMAIGFVSIFIRSVRWLLIVKEIDKNTKVLTCFNATNICYVINMLLPRLGEIIKCSFVTRHGSTDKDGKKNASFDKILGSVVIDRMWDVFMLFFLTAILFITMGKKYGVFFKDNMLSEFDIKDSGVFYLILGTGTALLAASAVVFLLRDKSKIFNKIYNSVKGIITGFTAGMKGKASLKCFLLSVTVWTGYFFTSYTLLLAVKEIDVNILPETMSDAIYKLSLLGVEDSFFLMIVGALSSLVPVPGGFGAFHYLVSMSMSAVFGIPMEIGVIFATLSHESQTVLQLICGAASYLHESFYKPFNHEFKNTELVQTK